MRTNFQIANELKEAIRLRKIVPNAARLRAKERVFLNVPFEEKNAVKALGARFDGLTKRWFVESDGDLNKFARWIPRR